MKYQQTKLIGKWVALALAAVILGGCASTGGGSKKARGPVVDRAEARWEALLAQDFDSAYEYYSPGFRSSTSRGDFELGQRLRKVQFTDAEYEDQDCSENRCTLSFKMFYTIASPVPGVDTWNGNDVLEETWIRTEGQWWFLPED